MRTHSGRKVVLTIVAAVFAIGLFAGGVYLIDRTINKEEPAEDRELQQIEDTTLYLNGKNYGITHNIESYLLIGTDDSGNEEAVGTDEYEGRMADFLLLCIMDKTDNTYGFLQINRDTMVDVPMMDREGNGEGEAFEQICTAHWYGANPEHGCNNTVFTVGELVGGLPIDGYYSFHMSDVGKLNHAVGGVEVTIKDDMTATDPAMKKGATLVLSDEQAEKFVRARMEVGEGENTERMERQREFMQAFHEKASQKIKEDPAFVNDLWNMLDASSLTNIPPNQVSVIANQMQKSKDLGVLQYTGEVKSGYALDDGKEHTEFYADEESIADAMVRLCGIDEDHITEVDDE